MASIESMLNTLPANASNSKPVGNSKPNSHYSHNGHNNSQGRKPDLYSVFCSNCEQEYYSKWEEGDYGGHYNCQGRQQIQSQRQAPLYSKFQRLIPIEEETEKEEELIKKVRANIAPPPYGTTQYISIPQPQQQQRQRLVQAPPYGTTPRLIGNANPNKKKNGNANANPNPKKKNKKEKAKGNDISNVLNISNGPRMPNDVTREELVDFLYEQEMLQQQGQVQRPKNDRIRNVGKTPKKKNPSRGRKRYRSQTPQKSSEEEEEESNSSSESESESGSGSSSSSSSSESDSGSSRSRSRHSHHHHRDESSSDSSSSSSDGDGDGGRECGAETSKHQACKTMVYGKNKRRCAAHSRQHAFKESSSSSESSRSRSRSPAKKRKIVKAKREKTNEGKGLCREWLKEKDRYCENAIAQTNHGYCHLHTKGRR